MEFKVLCRVLAALLGAFVLAACSGDDGADGRNGTDGTDGTDGQDGPIGPTGPTGPTGPVGPTGPTGPQGEEPQAFTESCHGCHDATLAEKHALPQTDGVFVKLAHWTNGNVNNPQKVDHDGDPGTPTIQLPAIEVNPTTFDVTLRFHVRVNGVARFDFNTKAQDALAHNEDAYWVWDAGQHAGVRTKITSNRIALANNGNGNYTATVTGFTALPAEGTSYMISTMEATSKATATAVAYYGVRQNDVVGDQACLNCHGNHVWRGAAHDVTNPQGVGPCIVCHNRAGSADPRLPGAGSGLMGIVHGIHNSHNMPDRTYTFTWTNGNQFNFSKGFPGNMPNCRTCHDTTARLDAVKDAQISYGLCISCHDAWTGFGMTTAIFDMHKDLTGASSCTGCHTPAARDTVGEFHDGLVTERAGLIWGGADQSMVLAPTIQLAITGVTVTATDVQVTWTAVDPTNANAAWDPCNQDYALGPVFFGKDTGSSEGCTHTAAGCSSNMSFIRAYALGNDWVNDRLTGSSAPGQPSGSTAPSIAAGAANTTCDAGTKVATTTLPLQTFAAGAPTPTRAIVALQGKAQVLYAPSSTVIWVRTVSPTREYDVATGAAPAVARRTLVDVAKCNACHPGTLYQHGGSRVDSIELCVMCHNPAASEQNRRLAVDVTAAEAYDGRAGETYDMRTMVHAIHSAGESQKPLMYYRNNGIFFFGAMADGQPVGVQNYPDLATDCVSCVDAEDGPLTLCKIFGSSTSGTVPEANPDGTCKTAGLANSTDGTWRSHRIVEVHYPRALNDCSACHVDGSVDRLPDPNEVMAVTFEAGAAPWNNLLDDVLIGPSAQSCMTCHQDVDPTTQGYLREHAYDFGWMPTVFDGGRQPLIDAAP